MESYSRGRRGAPAKGVGVERRARVQIPHSPPKPPHLVVIFYFMPLYIDVRYHKKRFGVAKKPNHPHSFSIFYKYFSIYCGVLGFNTTYCINWCLIVANKRNLTLQPL